MIEVTINKAMWEYDIHSLVKAFFPESQVKVRTPESKVDEREKPEISGRIDIFISEYDAQDSVMDNKDSKLVIQESEIDKQGLKSDVQDLKADKQGLKSNSQDLESELCVLETEKEDLTRTNIKVSFSEFGESVIKTISTESKETIEQKEIELKEIEQKEISILSATMALKKNIFKQEFYKILSDFTGKKLPWGNLTGIRPTKIAMGMLDEGCKETDIKKAFQDEHFVSDEKTELAIDIAKREKKILSAIHYKDGYSIYIGIPFCPTTCLYCSFTSYPICNFKDRVEKYIDCLIMEMQETAKLMQGKTLDTVYIGGGTPTTLSAEQLDRLISALQSIFDFSTVLEFTVEAGRADSITRDKLEVLYKHNVGRISVNPQTMKDETLRKIGRRHTTDDVKKAFAMAREIGFSNINMDIILGLPGEMEEDVTDTIRQIKEMSPDSLTVHSLAIKRASKLRKYVEENGIAMLCNTDSTMEIAAEGARSMDMYPYYLYRQKNMSGNFENVGYAREGKYGIYNILIMEEVQTIVALGAGSITKRVFPDGRIERCDNVKDVALYIEKIEEMMERKRVLFGE